MSKKIVLLVVAVLCLLFSWSLVMAQEQKQVGKKETILLVPKFGDPQAVPPQPVKKPAKGEPSEKAGAFPAAMGGITPWKIPVFGLEKLSVEDILQYFDGYDVETIEVWIAGKGKGDALIVSVEANTGVKVILKPKKTEPQKPSSKK